MSAQKMALFLNLLRPTIINIPSRSLHKGKAKFVPQAAYKVSCPNVGPTITSAVPSEHNAAKVIFDDNQTTEFKYIWLRDNCKCSICVHADTQQKLLDTPTINIDIRPKSLNIDKRGFLRVVWDESQGEHVSDYDPQWLSKYGESFVNNRFEGDNLDKDFSNVRPEYVLWDKETVNKQFPEVNYNEFMESEDGLRKFLEIFYKYGIAFLRGVPTQDQKIADIANRISYIKATQHGAVFDMKNVKTKGFHIAYSGHHLAHHSDMNYKDKTPGMEVLHCIKANDPKITGVDLGAKSFFIDGFYIAKWIQENKPSDFNILTSTPVRFSIKNQGMTYSAITPMICLDGKGDITEVHCNNRTMRPLQMPSQLVVPYYTAYQLFAEKCREPSNNLELTLVPGDLVAFNNLRILHGRTAFDPSKMDRHLQGVYMDLDEAFSKYEQLQRRFLKIE